jgi:hypothetical protein
MTSRRPRDRRRNQQSVRRSSGRRRFQHARAARASHADLDAVRSARMPRVGSAEGARPRSYSLPRPFDIREVQPEEEEEDPENAGSIEDWKEQLELLEKAKARTFITKAVVALWASYAVVCVAKFAFTGDAFPLVAPALLSEPLCIILRYYYGRSPPRRIDPERSTI